MIWAAQHLMPTLAGVVVLAGIVAAGLSSATTFLSLVAFSASHDVMTPGSVSDAEKLRISRWTMVGVGLAALALRDVRAAQHLLDHVFRREPSSRRRGARWPS